MQRRKPGRREKKIARVDASPRLKGLAVRAAYKAMVMLDAGHPAGEFRRKKTTYSKEFADFLVAADTQRFVSEHWATEIMQLAARVLGAAKNKL